MPVAQQGLRQVRTYEPCTTGYECFHDCLLSDHRGRPPIPLGSAMVSIAPPPGTRRSRVGWLPSGSGVQVFRCSGPEKDEHEHEPILNPRTPEHLNTPYPWERGLTAKLS